MLVARKARNTSKMKDFSRRNVCKVSDSTYMQVMSLISEHFNMHLCQFPGKTTEGIRLTAVMELSFLAPSRELFPLFTCMMSNWYGLYKFLMWGYRNSEFDIPFLRTTWIFVTWQCTTSLELFFRSFAQKKKCS